MGLSLFGCAEKYTLQSTHCALYYRVKTFYKTNRWEIIPFEINRKLIKMKNSEC